jgi:PmbA protein
MESLKKERLNLENATSQLLTFALKAGAQTAEVCGSYGQKTRISLEKQDYHLASSDDGYGLGIRVLVGQKQGFASCNTLEARDLKEVALRAVEIAGFSPENPHYAILPGTNVPPHAPLDLWDDSLFQLSLQTQKEWTKQMVNEAMKDKRFRLNEGSLEIGCSLFLVANSLGTHQTQKETIAAWSLMGMGVEGENITSFDYFSEMTRKAPVVLERLVHSTRQFRDRVLSNLKTGPAQSYRGVVLFSPRAALEILTSELLYHFNGRTVAEGTSRWKAQDIGKKVIDSSLTISDDAWAADRMGCSIFDREGTPTQNRVLLEKGHLRSFLLDNYAARALGLSSTGNAAGGPGSIPTVGSHVTNVAGGKESLKSLLKRIGEQQKEFLVVNRYSGQVDPVTGDFSGVAKGGDWWINGERIHSVKETLISGNLFEALGKSLIGISAETEVIDSSDSSPWLVCDQISVTTS